MSGVGSRSPALEGNQALLEARELTCVRDQRVLFEALTLSVAAGAIVQIEGVNGAGKTSLLRILCGLLLPQEGGVYWRGVDIRHCRPEYYAALLYIGHSQGLKDDLTALENLRFYQDLGTASKESDELESALDQVGLYGFEDVAVRSLSAGQRRRVALARLWLSHAPLWLLDEPLTALDSAGGANLTARLQAHREHGGSIVLTSHQPLRLESLHRIRLS